MVHNLVGIKYLFILVLKNLKQCGRGIHVCKTINLQGATNYGKKKQTRPNNYE